MGYTINYSPETAHKFPVKKSPKISVPWVLTGAALFLLLAGGWKWLLPGNPDVTQAAITNLVEDVQSGAPVGDAVTAFCREIIDSEN